MAREKKEDFMKRKYITCECGYNNEKSRFKEFGICLRCGKILDPKVHFKIEMRKKLLNNKRKRG